MPRRQKLHHYIYRTTCQVTGKFYVGMHSTDDLSDGYLGSGKILRYSLAKHGKENHKKEILEHLQTREALKLREVEMVNEELLADPLNINLKYGGEGGGLLAEANKTNGFHRKGWEAMMAKRDHSAGSKLSWLRHPDKMKMNRSKDQFGEHNGMFGKRHSEESREKQSAAHVGSQNSQFGTCWVSKDSSTTKIKKEQLEQYLADGYCRGRKKR